MKRSREIQSVFLCVIGSRVDALKSAIDEAYLGWPEKIKKNTYESTSILIWTPGVFESTYISLGTGLASLPQKERKASGAFGV